MENKCLQGCRNIGILIFCWWECKMVQSLWKITVETSCTVPQETNHRISNSTLRYISKRTESKYSNKSVHKCSEQHESQ